MRHFSTIGLLAVLCAVLTAPAMAAGMGVADARHLLVRTGFGATPEEIQRFSALSREAAVDQLLQPAAGLPVTPLPDNLQGAAGRPTTRLNEQERREYVFDQRLRNADLRAWWLTEMLHTPAPLVERMTLFWHNHFVSSERKVRQVSLMRDQNQLFRQYALGNFGTLLHAASKDPAMLLYLDAATNRAGAPNENFAREVMELFTLGEGHYTEADIKEAARAFTGWSIDRRLGTMEFRKAWHDGGEKRIFGKTGTFDGDDVLDLLLARPETSRFVIGKLWREFVSPTPDAAEVERVARVFREQRYELKPALRALLLSKDFWSDANRGALIKSPVEMVVGTLRTLQIDVPDALPFLRTLREQGQELLAPPNVKGWPGHDAWINASTLLERKQFLERLARAEELGSMLPPAAIERREQRVASAAQAPDEAMDAPARQQLRQQRQAQLQQRVLSAVQAIRIPSGAWQQTLSRTGLQAEDVVWASGHEAPTPMMAAANSVPRDLRSLLLDPVYQIK
ncbi:DUF1800 domain-containing protein [Viridibacterium curvum]|uniref:DUF1800 domain-containing protein n=1 Tax=Viridibacterium curvum TaxID=1101404 RepID=A0ABP9QAR0_9RHOO